MLPSTVRPQDRDYVVVRSGGSASAHGFAAFDVVQWPAMGESIVLQALTNETARAYACDLAREAGTAAWDMSSGRPERIDCDAASPES